MLEPPPSSLTSSHPSLSLSIPHSPRQTIKQAFPWLTLNSPSPPHHPKSQTEGELQPQSRRGAQQSWILSQIRVPQGPRPPWPLGWAWLSGYGVTQTETHTALTSWSHQRKFLWIQTELRVPYWVEKEKNVARQRRGNPCFTGGDVRSPWDWRTVCLLPCVCIWERSRSNFDINLILDTCSSWLFSRPSSDRATSLTFGAVIRQAEITVHVNQMLQGGNWVLLPVSSAKDGAPVSK